MTKAGKLYAKFKSSNGELTWSDLVSVLKSLGFEQTEGSGSRVNFTNGEIVIKLHKPHPQKEVRAYAIKQVKDILKSEALL